MTLRSSQNLEMTNYQNFILRAHINKSLKVLGTVGEPINPSAWIWYFENIGGKRCAIVDTWWQTETGGHMITTLPGLPQKPGFAGFPFFGVEASVVDKNAKEKPAGKKGFLVIKNIWPSALRTCWKNPECFEKYWNKIDNFYFTGDIAVKDKDGYIKILGRSDDVIVIAGHSISSAELESVLTTHKSVVEAAAVGIFDEIKGKKIVAFLTLKNDIEPSDNLAKEIIEFVGKTYGKHARPSRVKFVDKLPKTRSGKIMRRVLRAQEEGVDLGDISTLQN